MKYFIRVGDQGETKGPYTLDALRKSAEEGKLRWSTSVRQDGEDEWRPLEVLLGRGKVLRDRRQPETERVEEAGRRAAKSERERLGAADLGLVLFLLGAVLTAVSFALARSVGFGLVFTGLMAGGLALWYRQRFGPRH